jgi:uncharacterized protein YdaU (DUF1376 family)
VNFYKRFMGDYGKKTARLSLMEHGAYTLMLDEFYATEQGLPAAYPELFRICRAMTKTEQAAVVSVADQFFPVAADGLRYNGRANEELADAEPALSAARENGKKGGRPKKETQEKPSGFPQETQDEPGAKPPQSQSQNSPSLRSGERATRLPKGWEMPPEYRDFCRTERPDLDPDKVAAKFADYWHSKPRKEGMKLDWLATWRNWVRDERAPSGKRLQPEEDAHWTDSRSGVERKAQELGVRPWDQLNEQWPVFLGRVKKAAGAAEFGLGDLERMAAERAQA